MPDTSPDLPAMSPLAVYRQAVEQRGFAPDEAQRRAAEALERCFQALHEAHRHGAIQGVYLWGPVGRGKTWLMDHFYQCLRVPARRQHFHHFMQWVHQRQFELTGTADPLRALARELARDVRVLCFDELFVSDIGDAILLGSLLRIMFEEGVVLVATSNQPPEQLYADGFNRERFLPAIEAIQRHMAVVAVDGGQDHRLHPGRAEQRYWVVEAGQASGFAELFARLSAGEAASTQPIELGHRPLAVHRHSESVLWCSYAQLCEAPLSALDFIGLCDRYRAILMDDLPCLSASQREGRIARGTEDGAQLVEAGDRELPQLSVHDDGVRRFIALVDECYDRKVPLYLEARVPLETLYTEGYLAFAFRRTLSRLREMQLARFGSDSAG
ncbi:cell division protein ZapE [Pseudomonas aeruginosa]|uniref:cell division protein ZapE n=1 Tax=Pseudomonas aeruginosa TaxID=287 RepID=UPI0021D7ECE9|nr:cell division protein ZapE [Pseudomonas aeruginosa]MCO3662356.1 cell division protein ZapE [Pseudomonas aeruginosa]MCU8951604.1 cell division protein ZapE [Pseudomonas aeruginosa]MCU9121008.1 cell division protein ZapE [Pseudomonas aeruginosa]MCV4095507.1 cell division protein ZapE [Pseudomonas aeruginosa]WHM10388.1 cell division protein ZapE [Pseudomonas aeruginosa]